MRLRVLKLWSHHDCSGNKASQEFLAEDVIGDTAIYPDEATLENLYTISSYSPKVQRVITRMWTKIKSGI